MLSLKQKSDNFTVILREAAEYHGCVFMEDSGEGNELETDTILFENVSGWLIPFDKRDEFSTSSDRHAEKWNDFFRFAEWYKEGNDIRIDFKKYPIYIDTPVSTAH